MRLRAPQILEELEAKHVPSDVPLLFTASSPRFSILPPSLQITTVLQTQQLNTLNDKRDFLYGGKGLIGFISNEGQANVLFSKVMSNQSSSSDTSYLDATLQL